MVPVFGILMLFIINILPYISIGPLWDFRIGEEVQNCQESWWLNLLVITNIIKTDKQVRITFQFFNYPLKNKNIFDFQANYKQLPLYYLKCTYCSQLLLFTMISDCENLKYLWAKTYIKSK